MIPICIYIYQTLSNPPRTLELCLRLFLSWNSHCHIAHALGPSARETSEKNSRLNQCA